VSSKWREEAFPPTCSMPTFTLTLHCPDREKEIHMRVLIAVAAALSASLAMALPGEAQQKQRRSPDQSTARALKSDYYAKRARDDAHDCARAESLDAGGNYKAYPCWARAALAPKTPGG
jgi:hypothetical protein